MSPLPPGPTICSMWRPPLLGFQGHSGVMACWAAVSAPRVAHDPPENSTMRVRPGRPRLRGAQLQTVGGAGRFPSGDVRARGKSKTRRPKEGPAGRTLRAPRPPGRHVRWPSVQTPSSCGPASARSSPPCCASGPGLRLPAPPGGVASVPLRRPALPPPPLCPGPRPHGGSAPGWGSRALRLGHVPACVRVTKLISQTPSELSAF